MAQLRKVQPTRRPGKPLFLPEKKLAGIRPRTSPTRAGRKHPAVQFAERTQDQEHETAADPVGPREQAGDRRVVPPNARPFPSAEEQAVRLAPRWRFICSAGGRDSWLIAPRLRGRELVNREVGRKGSLRPPGRACGRGGLEFYVVGLLKRCGAGHVAEWNGLRKTNPNGVITPQPCRETQSGDYRLSPSTKLEELDSNIGLTAATPSGCSS